MNTNPACTIDELRLQAERETANTSLTRRPSWAPALVLTGELLEVCRQLEYLTEDGKPVARLWAVFADPKKLGTWQRDNLSEHPLTGHRVRGFELIAGQERISPKRIYRTLKAEGGQWHEDPRWIKPQPPWQIEGKERALRHDREFLAQPAPDEEVLRDRHEYDCIDSGLPVEEYVERCLQLDRFRRSEAATRIPKLEAEIAELTAQHEKALQHYRWHVSAFELGRQRLAEFLGNPEAQMLAGSRVTGRCSRCGAVLTDPISIERGIGPECIKRVAWHQVVPDLVETAAVERRGKRDKPVVVNNADEDDWMLPFPDTPPPAVPAFDDGDDWMLPGE